jgi:hypothetical protein
MGPGRSPATRFRQIRFHRQNDDIVFVEAALATKDRTIVTGNLADYPPEILQGARVLTPAQAATELAHNLNP